MAGSEEKSISELAELVIHDPTLRSAFDAEYRGPGDAGSALRLSTGVDEPSGDQGRRSELARLAFGRPDPDDLDAHLNALRELEMLAVERESITVETRRALRAVLDQTPSDIASSNGAVSAVVLLAAALVAILGVVLVALLLPAPSLSANRLQTRRGLPTSTFPSLSSARWISTARGSCFKIRTSYLSRYR